MMLIHLLIFNFYAVTLAVNLIVFYGSVSGYFHITFWQFAMTVLNFEFASELAFFIMLQFIAYLIVRFGNPDDASQDLFFRMLTF